jgi:thymidylate synthase (FAD)
MKAEYITHSGSDLTVVNAARVSFDKESYWENETDPHHGGKIPPYNRLSDKDKKLINYLAKHDHFTPFTHSVITLRETVPIFVARQRHKHTVGFSYNEVSRRYVDDPPQFYTPDKWRKRAENKKQGSSDEEVEWLETSEREVWDDPSSPFVTVSPKEMYSYLIEHSLQVYNLMINNGVAPEQARMVLPQSMYTSYYCTGSLAAFARAYNLRSQPDAQAEIRELAGQWNEIISPLFPEAWRALTNNAT